MRKILIFLLFPSFFLFADGIKLFNDSPFELTAIVQSADGKVIAQKNFAPEEQSVWSTDQTSTEWISNYDATSSYTPYTVIWRCSYEGYYSVCSEVAAGAMVTAHSCPGSKYCKPKPKKDQKNDQDQNNKKTSCLSCKPKKNIK
ncbi:MAG: hypothetical protein KR126chlam4_00298 [Candidatus Anoxychlamydiales bacterium]|uniref:Uncharacterized protein n=1 Tax=marine sediment metagenome TaxID=412755 RepID=A0A0F9JIW1_9ZZZZ|nr:hypothetical protein [Candidatus Anoxychlamydiales bacterium]HEU64736.1 hypothetical protein [Chlamydiota bacterium]